MHIKYGGNVAFSALTVFVRVRNKKSEIVLLDHGLYQEISESDRIALSHFWKAIVLNKHEAMKKHARELGVAGKEKLITSSLFLQNNFFLCRLRTTSGNINTSPFKNTSV